VSSVCALVAFSTLAFAQNHLPDLECRKTETQAECHSRLKCKPNEELEDCQKRLLKCSANEKLEDCKKRVGAEPPKEGNAGQRNDASKKAGDRDADKTGRNADETGRDREADKEGGERRDHDTPDRERGARDHRDEGATPRRQRGERQGDDGEHRRGGGGGGGMKGFQPNKTFGLGLELGEPTGLNGKYFLSKSGALDFGIGWIYGHYYYGDGLHIYADYLWHPISLVSASAFELPFYIGGGLRFWDFHYCYQGVCDYGGSALGIRIPIGIAFDFNNVPLDIFIQLVPVIDFVNGNYYDRYRDRTHFGIDLSVGIRYWFK
jgi:hypothetical protein